MKTLLQFVGLFVLAASTAQAHTELSSSMPGDEAVVDAAPKEVMLHFSQPVRLTMVSVQKAGGDKRNLGPLPSAAAKDFALGAPPLDHGRYVVSWRALSEDTHTMTGEFVFTIGSAGHGEHEPESKDGAPQSDAAHGQHSGNHDKP